MAPATSPATAHATRTKFRPLHDRVLVRRVEEQDEEHGRLIIPDRAREKPQEGEVITVGTGKPTDDGRHLPLTVKRGDRILFGKHSGSEIKLDGEEYLILKEEDVLGILVRERPTRPLSSVPAHTEGVSPCPSNFYSTEKPAPRSCAG
jgi:chaperonin GroES